jgi:hypothetical protein
LADRLPWERGDKPRHFIARRPEGTAEVWWHPTDTSGPEGWRWRVRCGETVDTGSEGSKQDAADRATGAWPTLVARERARRAKIDAAAKLEADLTEAHNAGRVDLMAFGVNETSEYQRLVHILDFVRRQGWLDGPLKPLVEAVSNELFRRRTRGK